MLKKIEWIKSVVLEGQRVLNLELWNINIAFVPRLENHEGVNTGDKDGCSAEIFHVDQHYMEAEIHFSKKFLRKMDTAPEQCFEDIIHELSHIYTDLTYDTAIKFIPKNLENQFNLSNEKLTQTLAKYACRSATYIPFRK